eukprot:10756393-Heterocapsa_arctica.AAC.1
MRQHVATETKVPRPAPIASKQTWAHKVKERGQSEKCKGDMQYYQPTRREGLKDRRMSEEIT